MAKISCEYVCLLLIQIALIPVYIIFVRYTIHPTARNWLPYHRDNEVTRLCIYVGFAFSMSFLKKYCYGAIGFNWLLAALVAQITLLTQGFIEMHESKQTMIYLNRRALNDADRLSSAVVITFGVLVGHASMAQLLFIAIAETFTAMTNWYLVIKYLKAADFGGSLFIHAYGAFFGIGVSVAWYCTSNCKRRVAGERTTHPLEEASYDSDVTAMIGSLLLYIYLPTFNSTGSIDGVRFERLRSYYNTMIALASCLVTTFAVSSMVGQGKLRMEHIQRSTLAGAVGVGSVCNLRLRSGGAIVVGMVSAFISVIGCSKIKPFLRRTCGLVDPCGVLHIHGMPAVFSGMLCSILAAYAEPSNTPYLDLLFKGRRNRTAIEQAQYQLIAVAATVGSAFLTGIFIGLITRLWFFKPVPKADQFNDDRFWEIP